MDNNKYILRTNDSEIHIFDNNDDDTESECGHAVFGGCDHWHEEENFRNKIVSIELSCKRLLTNEKFFYEELNHSYDYVLSPETLRIFAAYIENLYGSESSFSFCGNCIRRLYKTDEKSYESTIF